MAEFKQRVPIATVEGKNCYLTVEAVRMLNALLSGSSSTAGPTLAQFNSLVAQVNTLQSQVDLLIDANSDAQARIKMLEGGFQS